MIDFVLLVEYINIKFLIPEITDGGSCLMKIQSKLAISISVQFDM